MFFSEIYGSWRKIQEEKYEGLWSILGRDFFAAFEKRRVLDLGCGSGYFESFLRSRGVNAGIISVDVEFTKKVSPFVIADGDSLPFRDGSFDIVVCVDTAHLLGGSDFRRVLRKNGILLMSVFFNGTNYGERAEMLKEKLGGFEILLEFETGKRERDCVIVAKNSMTS
ncbi:MAG: class I SAM-dependent methyltransferase [Candidatus Aenigmarchaeota archaeon]|nr:class I SAM-dependent methyltransferase [Candidatus Aenigmarchaeota archaeon]